MSASYIYFLQAEGGGPIKIGFSRMPLKRLAEIATWSPFPLTMLASAPGNRSVETFLHQKFAAHRLHREWFWPVPGLVQVVLETKASGKINSDLIDIDLPWGLGPRPFAASRLNEVLREHGISMRELAIGSGVSYQTVATWLYRGVSDQSLGSVLKYFRNRGFDVSAGDLFKMDGAA